MLGLSLKTVKAGMGVSFVMTGSPCHKAGVRFGDVLLAINGDPVQGKSSTDCLRRLREVDTYEVTLELIDRHLLQTYRIVKEEWTSLGLVFRFGRIDAIKPGSLAMMAGIPKNSRIIEINGDLVVGLADRDLLERFRANGARLEVRIMPDAQYRRLVSRIPPSYVRFNMEHANNKDSVF